ncbi:hypothetical protein [Hyalangium sp.]|uniref:hypothetical protein n=1 Tax=Hyalangium sp. TaxID=2028555 RepID=UPI002D74E35D|nr:hypothetical protein [Hyalangium sp.]HYI01674.1 hypothetical protein [Hyalangium sp.]
MRALVIGALLAAAPAWAWQGMCRSSFPGGSIGGDLATSQILAESVCAMDQREGVYTSCFAGRVAARGKQLGEHAQIAAEAMAIAGLPPTLTGPVEVNVYTDGTLLPDLQNFPSLAPAAPGSMKKLELREKHLAEFAELPDVSHSLADFMLANEHCAVPNIQADTLKRIDSCHEFAGHMGALNASHWPPLARAYYDHYHQLAMTTAQDCARHDAKLLEDPFHSRSLLGNAFLEECEREALALEAFASHFLQDAWSSGHMWHRWGYLVPPSRDYDYLAGFHATLMTGVIHGTRAITGTHDRACMPGPFQPLSFEPIIKYRHGVSAQELAGGGDLYLEQCTSRVPGWSVRTMHGAQNEPQIAGMLHCAALGFREVYLAGPNTAGRNLPEIDTDYPFPMRKPTSSSDEPCWDMRLTNSSMYLSLGIHHDLAELTPERMLHPVNFSRFVTDLLAGAIENKARASLETNVTPLEKQILAAQFRTEAVRLAWLFIMEARDNPTSTSLATDHPDMASYMDVPRSAHWEADVRAGLIPFLEPKNHRDWNAEPGAVCQNDMDCSNGAFCDKTVVIALDGGLRSQPSCVPAAAAIQRAFRFGELPHWCKEDDAKNLELARAACMASPTSGDACSACADMLEPHLRDACGPEEVSATQPLSSEHSLCDWLGVTNTPVYAPFADGDGTARSGTALDMCMGKYGPTPITLGLRQPNSTLLPPISAEDPDSHFATTTTVCGRPQALWKRFRHQPSPSGHTHMYAVRVYGADRNRNPTADDITLEMFRGPGCTEQDRVPVVPQRLSSDGGAADTLYIFENVPANSSPEVCIKVNGAPNRYWTEVKLAHQFSNL